MPDEMESGYVPKVRSLLFAILDISMIGNYVEGIELCVIDITLIPKGTFLCDRELKRAFSNLDIRSPGKDLENLPRTLN